jgi:HWE histidine kinase
MFADQAARDVLIQAGVQAVYSTPLISSSGEALGMISTHFGVPHRPGESETQLIDLLARQAADYLERKRAESRQQLLLDELNHRVKNTLATVQSIVVHSLTAASGTDGRKTLEARLIALSRTHNLLAGPAVKLCRCAICCCRNLGPFRPATESLLSLTVPISSCLQRRRWRSASPSMSWQQTRQNTVRCRRREARSAQPGTSLARLGLERFT